MALKIKSSAFTLGTHPTGNVSALVQYRIYDDSVPDLGRTGTIAMDVPASLAAQLSTLAEDALRAAGKL